jgi:hypothetical protein
MNMRTKTLLIAAAALAVGVISSQAQTVYSANVVGYVNVSLPAGYSMVANQLDLDGTGTNNTIISVLGTNLPSGLYVYCWNGTIWAGTRWLASGKWSTASPVITNAMQPGVGFFVNSPVATNVVLVGNVIQGTNTYPITAGYQVVSPNTPQTGGIVTTFGYTPTVGDYVYTWNGTIWAGTRWLASSKWSTGEPTFTPGVAMFLNAKVATNWTQSFVVH